MKMSATKLLLRIILKLLLPQNKLFNFLELFKLILLVSFNPKLVSEMSSLFSRSILSQLLLLLSSQSSVSSLNSLLLHRKSTKANLPRLWTLSNNFCLNSEINKLITNSSTLQLLANSMNLLTISMSSFRTPRTPLPIKMQLLNSLLLVLLNSLTSSAVFKVSLLLLTDNSKPLMILAHHTRQITLRSRAKCKLLSLFCVEHFFSANLFIFFSFSQRPTNCYSREAQVILPQLDCAFSLECQRWILSRQPYCHCLRYQYINVIDDS